MIGFLIIQCGQSTDALVSSLARYAEKELRLRCMLCVRLAFMRASLPTFAFMKLIISVRVCPHHPFVLGVLKCDFDELTKDYLVVGVG